MNEDFIRKRITQLRLQKNVSEYKMSFDLGHSRSYIQSISSGRALPSLPEFLYICDYFGITPAEFFNMENAEIIKQKELNKETQKLTAEDIDLLISIAKRLNKTVIGE